MRVIGDKDMDRGVEIANGTGTDTYEFMTFNNYGYPDDASSFVLQYFVKKQEDNNLCAPGAHNSDSFCGMTSDGDETEKEDPFLACNVYASFNQLLKNHSKLFYFRLVSGQGFWTAQGTQNN
jgi:hypothetical protein